MYRKKCSIAYRAVQAVVKAFTPKYDFTGLENLPKDGPCVIVANHAHMYGPIAAQLYPRREDYIWCESEMMNRKEVPDYAYSDFWGNKPKPIKWFFRLLSYIIAPFAVFVFKNARVIPVYRDKKIIDTFRETIEKLEAGNNIVIFPERHKDYNNVVWDFQERFIDIGKFYEKNTGKPLSFVPAYVCPKLKLIIFGKAQQFDPEKSLREERDRIKESLMNEITELAISLPKHKVVPYENMSSRKYPSNK